MPRWVLTKRAVHLEEIMDDPDCDPVLLNNTYDWFTRLNPWLGRWKAVYRSHVRPHLHAQRPTRILDIGCGAGDVLRLIAWRPATDARLNWWVLILTREPLPTHGLRSKGLSCLSRLAIPLISLRGGPCLTSCCPIMSCITWMLTS